MLFAVHRVPLKDVLQSNSEYRSVLLKIVTKQAPTCGSDISSQNLQALHEYSRVCRLHFFLNKWHKFHLSFAFARFHIVWVPYHYNFFALWRKNCGSNRLI